jgi:LacI family transcriptional regulator
MARQKVSIKDVAARAKVHPSTVSRVLNPETRSMVSNDVAERVTKIAEDMGYARSSLAAGLRTGKSFTVGVIIPDLSNPVFPPVVRGIERTLSAEGYIAILADSDNSRKSEQAIFDSLRTRGIDGLILATAHIEDAVVDACVKEQLPVVLVNRMTEQHDVTEVVNNDKLGIELAIAHLTQLGHTRIAFLGGPGNTSTGRDRRNAFESLGTSGSFAFERDMCVECPAFKESEGRTGMLRLLDRGKSFSAVVCANDLLALGCYDAMQERGLSCPGDLSVTGFNDMPFADRLSPPLTSLHIQHDQLGVNAANCLLDEMRGGNKSKRPLLLDPSLMVRGSTASPTR